VELWDGPGFSPIPPEKGSQMKTTSTTHPIANPWPTTSPVSRKPDCAPGRAHRFRLPERGPECHTSAFVGECTICGLRWLHSRTPLDRFRGYAANALQASDGERSSHRVALTLIAASERRAMEPSAVLAAEAGIDCAARWSRCLIRRGSVAEPEEASFPSVRGGRM
jgi:hypothetical protein